ncbi:hypothetical protein UA08_08846 [Talaromyces atroroseus]|uniref:Uncharacterized protein n=1 Tax=Talaromyces atroroseus TaxID=1441469 RepID=A0A225A5Z0_TALAT|nr:hypothetical protein UA08_08846 [Talaromyces atroroseus]OKL55881.1 hypothetical protein UA08_08846 [Talaromyces atroroseus]
MNATADKPKLQRCERRSSTSSDSSNSSSDSEKGNNNNDDDGDAHSHTRIRRSKIDTSDISESNLKRSKVVNSTLTTVRSAKWTKIKSSAVTNVNSMKVCEMKSAHVEDVDSLRRAVVERSIVVDCIKIKRGKIRDSTVRRVVLGRSTLDNCEAVDSVIYGSKFTGMMLVNGIWKNGSLVGKVDETKEVIFRPLDKAHFYQAVGISELKSGTEKFYQTPINAKDKSVTKADGAKDWEAGYIEPLPRYESRWLMR